MPEGAAEPTTDLLVVTSAGPKAGRKFLRAFCCPRHVEPHRASAAPGATGLLVAWGPVILLVGALAPALRPAAAIVLVAGWVALSLLRSPAAVAWAAVLPVAVLLASPWVLGADAPLGGVACRDPGSGIVVRRLVAAAVVLGMIGALAWVHRSNAHEMGLRSPARAEAALALTGALVLAAGGLVIGPAIAEPFFGRMSFPVPLAALLPAVLFGIANGVLEEVAYRGAMQAWLARVAPMAIAIAFQGLVFGIVHAGPDVVALLPLHVALLTAVGIAGGLARMWTGSLAIPIGIHVGADIALYVGLACRAPGAS